MARLRIAHPGLVEYRVALAGQERLLAAVQEGADDVLLLLEHPPVYTLGRGADPVHLRDAGQGDIPSVRVGRGGQVTFHGPGQLVGYPILDLRRHRQDVRWYVGALEAVLIAALSRFGITADRRAGFPGVWVDGTRKIASIGVGIRRWVTWHGFALNVGPNLDGFGAITPCGIGGVVMTSMAREGVEVSLSVVGRVVETEFARHFRFESIEAFQVSLGAAGVDESGAAR
jgi:lipoyl(octanoyl) transferase